MRPFRISRKSLRHLPKSHALGLSLASWFVLGGSSYAASLSWTATSNSTLGGSGSWSSAGSNWWIGASAQDWTPNTITDHTAVLAGAAGTVTLGESINALGLNPTTTGYTVALGTNTLALGAGGIDASTLTSGSTTISGTGTLSLGANQAWNVGAGSSVSVSSIVAGTGVTLTKSGAGTVALSGANSYTGTTSITGGTVAIGANNNLGTSALTLDGGTLQVTLLNTSTATTNTHTTTIGAGGGTIRIVPSATANVTPTYNIGAAGLLTGSGTLSVVGTGALGTPANNNSVLVLGNANSTYTGGTVIQNGGIVEINNVGALGSGAVTVNSQGMLSVNNLTLPNAITLNGGILQSNANTAVFGGNVSLGAAGGTLRTQNWYSTAVRTLKVSGIISGSTALTIDSGASTTPGLAQLSGTNTYSGGTTINTTNVDIQNAAAFGTGSVTVNGSSRIWGGAAVTVGNSFAFNGTSAFYTGSNITYTGAFSGAGTLDNTAGNGGATLNVTGDLSGFNGSFKYLAGTSNQNNVTIGGTSDASMDLSHATVILSGSSGGARTLTLGGTGPGNTFKAGDLNGAGQLTVASGKTLEVGNLNLNTTFSGVLAGTGGALKKVGSGTWTLTGASTHTGTTTVAGGTLFVSGSGSVNGSSGIVIGGSGARLVLTSSVASTPPVTLTQGTLDGTGAFGAVTVADFAGNAVQNGNGTGAGLLSLGSLTFSGLGTLNIAELGTSNGIEVTGALVTPNTGTGKIIVNASNNVGWTSGSTYTLLSAGSGITGTLADFTKGTITGLGARQSATLGLNAGGLTLTISGDTPVWTGAASGVWSTATIASPRNWKLKTAGTATDFQSNDQVLFNDSATGSTSVTINDGTVSPASTTFDNNSKNYTVSGSNGINTGFLIKSGDGTLTLTNTNNYSGSTTIDGGTLCLGDGSNGNDGSISNTSGVINNSSLVYNRFGANAASYPISGTGSVTKAGPGSQTLSGNNSYTGGTTINGGSLVVGSATALGPATDASVSFGAASNGTLSLNGYNLTLIGLSGDSSTTVQSNSSTAGTDILTVNNLFAGTFGGTLKDGSTRALGLTKGPGDILILNGTNNYSGPTVINGSILEFQTSAAMSSTSALTIGNGGTLSLRADADTSFTAASLGAFSGVGNTYNIQVNSLNSPAGDGHTFTINGPNGSAAASNGVNLSIGSSTGGTLKFGSTFQISSNSGAAGGGDATNFNLTNSNVILTGLSQSATNADGGIVVSSAADNSLTLNGVASTNTNRTLFATVNSGTLVLNNTVTTAGGANSGLNVNLNGGTLNIQNAGAIFSAGNNAGLKIAGGTLNNTNGAALIMTGNSPTTINGDFAFGNSASTAANDLNLGTGTVSLGGTAGTTRSITTQGSATLTLGGIISNGTTANGITKSGTGKLVLNGANTYTGDTTVNAGTLAIGGASIANTGKVVINGGVIALTGTEVVDTLYFGASQQAAGTWGATGSGATHIDNTRFSGTGVLSVTHGGSAYESWASSMGLTAGVNDGATQDPEFDGISNVMEFVLGGNPLASDTGKLPVLTTDATNFIFTFNRADASETEIGLIFQWGSTLTGWTDVAVGADNAASGSGVDITENSTSSDTIVVTIPKTSAVGGKLFGRLKALK